MLKTKTLSRCAALALLAVLVSAFAWAGSAAAEQSLSGTPMPVGQDRNWNLIFGDSFEGPGLDPTHWQPNRPGGPQLNMPYNPELEAELYDPANVTVRNGSAVLQITRPAGGTRFPFRSGVMQSWSNFSFRYGYIEARVKVSACHGCWPAFWLLEDNENPYELSNTEVDVFEFFSTKRLRQPYFNYHWAKFSAATDIKRAGRKHVDYTRAFHTYGLYWRPGSMQVFVDGRPGPAMTGPLVTDVPMYPIFNLGVFRGGRPGKNAKMAIDYVRAWQRP